MGKRKKDLDREDIKRKIRKWEEKLKKSGQSSSRAPPSQAASSPASSMVRSVSPTFEIILPQEEKDANEPTHDDEPTTEAAREELPIDEDTIPEEFLLALGEEGTESKTKGSPINEELVQRWTRIMTSGLDREAKAKLNKKYLEPENFSRATAPILNQEISGSLSETSIRRDQRMIYQQNELGKMLSCMGICLSSIMKGNFNSFQIIEQINDAAKLAANMFHQVSATRKFCALSGASKEMLVATKNTVADEYLLGKNLMEKIKSAEAMSKANQKARKDNSTLNYKNPPRGQKLSQRPRGGRAPFPSAPYRPQRRAPPPPPLPAPPPPPPRYSYQNRRHPPPPPPRYNQRRY